MKSERGQELVSTMLILGCVAIIFLMAYYLVVLPALQKIPQAYDGTTNSAGYSQAVAMPEVQLPNVGDHAADRHGDVIASAVSCFSGSGLTSPIHVHRTGDNHDAWVCIMDFKIFIWIVDQDGNTVTQFQNKAKDFEGAFKYLAKQGYH
jgi:hypothetical protein